MLYERPVIKSKRKINWHRWIFTCAALLTVGILLLMSYLAFHKQVYMACKLTADRGVEIPEPFKATCIQLGVIQQ